MKLYADDSKILAIVDTVIEREKVFRKIWTPYQFGCENGR